MTDAPSALIVTADPLSAEALRHFFSRLGQWKILEARNVGEAKTAVGISRPDIILVNDQKRELDGFQVTESILTTNSESRVIFLSANNSMVQSAFKAGALGFVRTDQIEADLMAAIEQLLLGRTFFTAEAVRLLRLRHHRNPFPGEHKTLTTKEVTLLQQVALGTLNKDIATNLKISIRTVENERARVMKKLGLENLSELVRYAIRTGIIDL